MSVTNTPGCIKTAMKPRFPPPTFSELLEPVAASPRIQQAGMHALSPTDAQALEDTLSLAT